MPEKGEASGFITLATNVFVFLNKHFLCSKTAYVTRYVKTGMTEQQVMILAMIIRDLDRETARTEVGKFYVAFPINSFSVNCFNNFNRRYDIQLFWSSSWATVLRIFRCSDPFHSQSSYARQSASVTGEFVGAFRRIAVEYRRTTRLAFTGVPSHLSCLITGISFCFNLRFL